MLLTASLCLPMNGCSLYRIEKGYGYFTELPPMFIGIQTNQVEYPLDDVSLDISYGWPEEFVEGHVGENQEGFAVLIVAYDWTMVGNLPFDEPQADYNAYISADNVFLLKEIREDFSNETYRADVGDSWFAKVTYNAKETFRLPEELFGNLTKERGSVYLSILFIARNTSDGMYLRLTENTLRLYVEVTDDGRVILAE